MDQEFFDWALLLGRWLHITTAITWIGTSIFFMWLDRTFEFNQNSKSQGHVGDLWMVHGGGFYHVEKLLMGPTKVPENLHWFKWESYWTWLSGLFLTIMIFYVGSGTFLIDSSVSAVTYWQAVAIGVGSILISWLFYDFLWETNLTKNNAAIGHIFTLLWFAGVSYFLCSTLSGRAAYLHTGAMLGTWMTANVFLRIIPRQVKMVEAAKTGESVNQDWGKNAKNRSTHNTYFTLPVIFLMLSNHFPSTYGNRHAWIILLLMCASGAAIREFFVLRLKNPIRSKVFGAAGSAIILGVAIFSRENTSSAQIAPPVQNPAAAIEFENSGGLKGTIEFTGTPPRGERIQLSPDCAKDVKGEVYSNEVIVKDKKLKNVLLRITKGLEQKTYTDIPQGKVEIDQRKCVYEPRVVAVRVGQAVEFINSDPTFHNVRSVTKNNEDFNVAMPSQNQRMIRVFNKPEMVLQTKCSVHPWMTANIAVLDHPFFSISDDKGEFAIKNIPAGFYTIEAWHETLGVQSKEIEIKSGQDMTVDFTYQK